MTKARSTFTCSVSGPALRLSWRQSRYVMFCLSWKEKDSEPRSADLTVNSLTEVEVATAGHKKKERGLCQNVIG